MNKKEVLEIKKRFKKEAATIDKIAGCYVDCNKQKICKIGGKFLSLDDEEYFKYLDIAKKSLSGTIGNNLLNLEFPIEEESKDGRQNILINLRNSNFDNEDLLDKFYDLIIDTYETSGNYFIILFHDSYDIPIKTSDNMTLDDSEEVYEYIICAICPVALSKPALGYREDEKRIGSRIRDWVVGAPETSILFPSFTDRSSDIHSCLFYTKNAKEPHSEFMTNGLGCPIVRTSTEKRELFHSIVKNAIGNESDNVEEVYLNMQCGLAEVCEEYEETHTPDDEPAIIDERVIKEIAKGIDISEEQVKQIADTCEEEFGQTLDIFSATDSKLVENSEDKLQIIELKEKVKVLSNINNTKNDDIYINTNSDNATAISKIVIDGKTYLSVPENISIFLNNMPIDN